MAFLYIRKVNFYWIYNFAWENSSKWSSWGNHHVLYYVIWIIICDMNHHSVYNVVWYIIKVCFLIFRIIFFCCYFWMQANEFGSELVDIAAKELLSIATPGQGLFCIFLFFFLYLKDFWFMFLFAKFLFSMSAVTDVQLKRAKESTKAAVLMNLESRVCSLSLSHTHTQNLLVFLCWVFDLHFSLPHIIILLL